MTHQDPAIRALAIKLAEKLCDKLSASIQVEKTRDLNEEVDWDKSMQHIVGELQDVCRFIH